VATFAAVYDACVLFPAPLRDLLVRLARTGVFRARWTDEIHEEWIRNLLAKRSDLTAAQLDRTRSLMDAAVPDCLVRGYEPLVPGLQLPDADDRHVLAAAICSQAGAIVTYNIRDFPPEALAPYGIEVQHPDEFVRHLYDLAPGVVCQVVRELRADLKNPTMTAREVLDTFLRAGLATTVAALEPMETLL
jgi:predicted nucleic acid-binding protein